MKILGVARSTTWDEMDGPQYYRAYLPLKEVNRHDNGVEAHMIGQNLLIDMDDAGIAGWDALVYARIYHKDCDDVLDLLHKHGCKMVIDTDDDFTETYKLISGHGEDFKEVLGKVDYATVSTQPLADLYAQYTKNPPVVLKNHVDVEWMVATAAKARRITTGLTMGFTGSPTHWGDWRLPAVSFKRIVREYDNVTPLLHGAMPGYMKYIAPESRLIELGGVPFSIYPVILSQFDVVFCAVDPLDRFNDGKSGVKALESMSLGKVAICSPFQPYQALADAGAPIHMVKEHSVDGWYEAMRTVIEDEEYREDLSSRSFDWVSNNRDMTNTGHKQWSAFYRSIK